MNSKYANKIEHDKLHLHTYNEKYVYVTSYAEFLNFVINMRSYINAHSV